ncbi:hypothetical protein BTUL_0019g00970 [Botrytis tulipae]|uniref:Uncharacterized protein n=1 Tax=Botrytis tulipae TaxID=87230 RepID=A0A4Z1EYR6_9HELO|nr:hypothetical protein BTUL_0019g00970 [Botrytis tulipae]
MSAPKGSNDEQYKKEAVQNEPVAMVTRFGLNPRLGFNLRACPYNPSGYKHCNLIVQIETANYFGIFLQFEPVILNPEHHEVM